MLEQKLLCGGRPLTFAYKFQGSFWSSGLGTLFNDSRDGEQGFTSSDSCPCGFAVLAIPCSLNEHFARSTFLKLQSLLSVLFILIPDESLTPGKTWSSVLLNPFAVPFLFS